jgi:flagellar protein FliO/FliZ
MEVGTYFRFVLALAFVLGLIGLLAWVARRYGVGSMTSSRRAAGKRLSISEVMQVDARRRLVLVRRDDTEHLVLLGMYNDTLIETGIPARDFAELLPAATGEEQATGETKTGAPDPEEKP